MAAGHGSLSLGGGALCVTRPSELQRQLAAGPDEGAGLGSRRRSGWWGSSTEVTPPLAKIPPFWR